MLASRNQESLEILHEFIKQKFGGSPLEVVLSITSAINSSFCPKYNLFPILIFLKRDQQEHPIIDYLYLTLLIKTPHSASGFFFISIHSAGNTLVLLKTITSSSSKYSIISLNCLCSIFSGTFMNNH